LRRAASTTTNSRRVDLGADLLLAGASGGIEGFSLVLPAAIEAVDLAIAFKAVVVVRIGVIGGKGHDFAGDFVQEATWSTEAISRKGVATRASISVVALVGVPMAAVAGSLAISTASLAETMLNPVDMLCLTSFGVVGFPGVAETGLAWRPVQVTTG
jgi:hypothetical protein